MELDWCSDENLSNFEKFNENSVINKDKKKNDINVLSDANSLDNLKLNDCFSLNLQNTDKKNILSIIDHLSFISNNLRTSIRNKSSKFGNIKELEETEYNDIIRYINWLIDAIESIKKFFAVPVRRDNSYDPSNIKLFKTSSYKFCNFKESCTIHKNKQSKCEKNHFVFDMIVNDIIRLKESIEIIGLNNINWLLNNKLIIGTYDPDTKNYSMENINGYNDHATNTELNFNELDEYQFIIDKTLIFKSFDVISYVLNKMYDESFYFLNNNTQTLLISSLR